MNVTVKFGKASDCYGDVYDTPLAVTADLCLILCCRVLQINCRLPAILQDYLYHTP